MGRVAGKVAIVTGAGLNERGLNIGGAIAELLAREGASVLIATRTLPDAQALAARIRQANGTAQCCALDQGDEASIQAMVDFAITCFGGLDILVNNAVAVLPDDTTLLETSIETWDRIMAVNPRGVFLASKFAVPHMLARGGGSIVNISSGSGVAGDATRVAYGPSKAAINTLTQYVATQYGKQNIRCNAITPGLVLSSKAKRDVTPEALRIFEKQTLTPYLGEPEHIAWLALFLASDEAAFITGAIIPADGGLLAHQTYTGDMVELAARPASAASPAEISLQKKPFAGAEP